MKIKDVSIGMDSSPYVIAEIGSNHNQSLKRALEMIDLCTESGANAVKFQSIQGSKIFYEFEALDVNFKNSIKAIELNTQWLAELSCRCKKNGIAFICSPTYEDAIGELSDVGVDCLKIASPQAFGDRPLVTRIMESDHPTLISFGYSSYEEIGKILELAERRQNIGFLHCVSQYPTDISSANLRFIKTLSAMTNGVVGFSDHTLGSTAAIVAVGLGAKIFEKHVTMDRGDKGPDHSFALEFDEFRDYVVGIREAHSALGDGTRYKLSSEEYGYRRAVEKSAVFSKSARRGTAIKDVAVEFLRVRAPINGIALNYEDFLKLSGQVLNRNVSSGELLTYGMIEYEDS